MKPAPTIGDKTAWGEQWPPRGETLIAAIRKTYGPRALLAFSRGKDAIGTWLALRESGHFDDVVPIHFDLVPGLEFVAESLDYYERFFGTTIYRLPHPKFYEWLRGSVFQTPSRIGYIESLELPPDYDFMTAHRLVREEQKLGADVPCANGIRAADSPMRRIAIMTHGPISYASRQWTPIWDWTKPDLIRAFDAASVKLPVDYRVFGRTFDGLDYRFLAPMKRELPNDYRRLLEWFPLAEVTLWRMERMG